MPNAINLDFNFEWDDLFEHPKAIERLEQEVFPAYLRSSRWFGGKAKVIDKLQIERWLVMPLPKRNGYFLVLKIDYQDSLPERYALTISHASEGTTAEIEAEHPQALIAYARFKNKQGAIYDSIYRNGYRMSLIQMMANNEVLEANQTLLSFYKGTYLTDVEEIQQSKVLKVEQSNSSIIYDNKYFLKLYRKIDYAINPDVEVTRFLSEKTNFRNLPLFAGSAELRNEKQQSLILGMLMQLVDNEGDAWTYTLKNTYSYFDKLIETAAIQSEPPTVVEGKDYTGFKDMPAIFQQAIDKDYFNSVKLLAQRTAEMHIALGKGDDFSSFGTEPLTLDHQNRFLNETRNLVESRFNLLQSLTNILQENVGDLALKILNSREKLLHLLEDILSNPLAAKRIRIHGDYHLGQVLYTGDDFIIIDFEGEPDKPFADRRNKYSCLKDLAGMVRSFHYAAYATIYQYLNQKGARFLHVEAWADQWYHYIGNYFLNNYIDALKGSKLLPQKRSSILKLLQAYILEKAVYELGYELNNRPEWVIIPLKGISYILKRY
ncbi:MAG: putative maltokinase [Chitinophagales bacterium]